MILAYFTISALHTLKCYTRNVAACRCVWPGVRYQGRFNHNLGRCCHGRRVKSRQGPIERDQLDRCRQMGTIKKVI